MPQYGAFGYARDEGKKYDWILAHYYKGTTLGQAPISTVRVLLAEGRRSVRIGSTGTFSATDARGRTFAFPAKQVTLGPGLKVKVGGRNRTLASPVTFKPGPRNLQLGGRAYRGRLVVRSNGTRVSVVNSVGLEKYLFGVVPDEMPPSWSMEALKAQAVAARSYAVVSRKTGGTFDLYADTRSQVYGGVPSEDARSTAAIQATAGKVVKYKGAVAWTFFHSTSGGRTASIQHVWNASPLPYLVSVADPHDGISPYHNWGPFRYTATELKRSLGSLAPAGALRDATIVRNGSKRVETVTFRGNGGTREAGGPSVQARLGLRSSWFAISVLRLGGPTGSPAGKLQRLTGIARGFSKVWLERKVGSAKWTRVRDLTPKSGKIATNVRPRATTWFRLGSQRGVSPAHRIKVTTAGAQRAAALGALIAP
jgi:stage II sporulation protein D